jgi:hypothetical protein
VTKDKTMVIVQAGPDVMIVVVSNEELIYWMQQCARAAAFA